MKFFGDIKTLSGYELPVVDCITGGSPCQDLSVAGKRAGLDGERSGLFMEQIRIVKEMRERDRRTGRSGYLVRPRYMVWENVPGTFSSNHGEDFQAVLTEIVRIADPEAPDVPMPDKGRWDKSGCLYSDVGDWSIAWRVHDAQFWGTALYVDGGVLIPGTPQRRKRLALVADFGGLSAPEVLFERQGLSGDTQPCGTAREEAAGGVGGGVASTAEVAAFMGGQGAKAGGIGYHEEVSPSLKSVPSGGNTVPTVVELEPICVEMTSTKNTIVEDGISPTLTARMGTGGNQVNAVCVGGEDIAQTLDASYYEGPGAQNGKELEVVAYFQNTGQGWWNESNIAATIRTPCGGDSTKANLCSVRNVVRRLTPEEWEALQGYPRGYTAIGEWIDSTGKKHKEADSPRYKALGNSIALPFWFYLLRRISAQYERPATLGSLFDGIGGFPLCWERCNGQGTALWTSEIEEFPIAVVKHHFGGTSHV